MKGGEKLEGSLDGFIQIELLSLSWKKKDGVSQLLPVQPTSSDTFAW